MKDKSNHFFKFKGITKLQDRLSEYSIYEPKNPDSNKPQQNQFKIGLPLALIFLFSLMIKLFFLQIEDGFLNFKLAEGNRIKNIPVSSPRGAITDENGKILAGNDSTYQLLIRANRKKDLDKIDQKLFEIAKISKEEVSKKIESTVSQTGYCVVREKIDRDEALLIKSRLPLYGAFEITPTFIRKYSDGNLSHILGYVGKLSEEEAKEKPYLLVNGTSGKTGLEKVYDQYLQGTPGYNRAEVDASNKLIRLLSNEPPRSGGILQTSINQELQNEAMGILAQKAKDLNTYGSVIIEDPRTGEIKALANYPSYDNSKFATGISQEEYKSISEDPSKPLLNRAIAGVYPSGSSIKPFIATSALEFNIITDSVAFETPPFIEIGQWKFPDWKDHGYTDVRRAIAESNNIFFYALGGGWGPIKTGLGPEGMKKGLERFGFDSETGIDLTGESEGFIPTPEWKKKKTGEPWFIGNTYNMAIGQGDLLVTPLQIANATSAIVNGGTLYKPHFAKKITDQNGTLVKEFKTEDFIKSRDIFSENNLDVVKEGMRMTVTEGSAKAVFGDNFPISVAAKTGTAQYGTEEKTHAWFTSFAPYENPELVITVIVEGGGEGYQTAAPIARDIYKWWSENK